MLKEHFLLLSMLKKVMLLNISVETVLFQDSLHLFRIVAL